MTACPCRAASNAVSRVVGVPFSLMRTLDFNHAGSETDQAAAWAGCFALEAATPTGHTSIVRNASHRLCSDIVPPHEDTFIPARKPSIRAVLRRD